MLLGLVLFLILFPLTISIPAYFISKKWPKVREAIFIGSNVIEMIVIVFFAIMFKSLDQTEVTILHIFSFKVDTFRILYSLISIFLWLMTITFSKQYMHHYEKKERYYFFYLVSLAGVVGLFLSNDLLTAFIFFELMSFAIYPLIIHEESEEALNVGTTYLGVTIIASVILLIGIFLVYNQVLSLSFDNIKTFVKANGVTSTLYAGGILLLFGFGSKADMYPLHIWLPKTHPVPAPVSALLSGIVTKCGVFGIIIISSNIFFATYSFAIVLLILAVITMFLGALLALFSTNLKRTLACSSMSQIGFILVGLSFMILLGEEGGLAQCGALLHMVNHSLLKLVLYMCAGIVAMSVHVLDLNKLRGFGRKKPFLMIIFLIGTLGIMGIPFFNGYTSKTMIHEAIVEYIHLNSLTGFALFSFKAVEWIFLLSGGLTVAYMTKIFVCLFIEKNSDSEKQKEFDNNKKYITPLSIVVFTLSVILIPVIGVIPNIINQNIIAASNSFFGVEKFTHHISFFGWESLKGALISISIGLVVYFGLVRTVFIKKNEYVNLWPAKLDLDTLILRPVMTNGAVLFTLYFVRYLAIGLDFIIYLFHKKSKNKAIAENTSSENINNDDVHHYTKKVEFIIKATKECIHVRSHTFPFTLELISYGLLLIAVVILGIIFIK